jgi:diguanylate cyclase (GGDEF)-like protein
MLEAVRFGADHIGKDGKRVRGDWIVAPLIDETRSVTGYLGIVEDVAERTTIRRLEDLAFRDSVTGMANRRAFDERLAALLESRRRRNDALAVLYVDLDDFKSVNDRHGHAIGDRVLAAIGLRLQVCVRDSDLVARLGGDEFGVILTRMDDDGYAEEVAARIVESVGHPLDAGTLSFEVHASIGIARFPGDGTDAAALLLKSDQAMYRAKQKGKSTYSL